MNKFPCRNVKQQCGHWIFMIKFTKNGEEQYNPCFITKGYSRIVSIDYHVTFSPTLHQSM